MKSTQIKLIFAWTIWALLAGMAGGMTALLLSGCQAEYPRGIESMPVEIDGQRDMVNHLKKEVTRFYTRDSEDFDERLDVLDVEPMIWWSFEECPDDGSIAVIHRDRCLHGLTFSCEEIFVAWRGPVERSALAHELGHCFLLNGYREGDGNHEQTQFWALINDLGHEI